MKLTQAEIRYLRSLSQKKVRREEQKFLVEGWRSVQEALRAGVDLELVALVSPDDSRPLEHEVLGQLRKRKILTKAITETQLASVSNTVHAQGILAVARYRKYKLTDVLAGGPRLLVALDAVADPGNLGTIIRTCSWFGVDAMLLGNGSVELHNEKVVRSTAGSIFHLPIVEEVDLSLLLTDVKAHGYRVVALSGDASQSYLETQYGEKCLLVFGSEAHGLTTRVRLASDAVVKIPRAGRGESLNLGIACGVVLAHLRSRERATD
jgi:TrmH family RNA methyltransferase